MFPHNLPIPRTPLIGRERELTDAVQRLMHDDVALLTLTGPGGTGKTRLGLHVASQVSQHFVDGTIFVPLAPVRDPGLVPSALAQALAVQESSGRPVAEVVKDHLREKLLLLVLDNFEQVVEAGPYLTELLLACRRLKVLVTSRAVLHLSEESDFPVPPLELPTEEMPPAAVLDDHAEAVRLFVSRAQAVCPDFRLTDANAPTVAEICRRLDGLPLAIELAAARVRHLSLPAILGRLEHRFALLTSGAQDLPPRQQTLRATIAWSYDLLSETEQSWFRRLSVFVGGCTVEALGAVCDDVPPSRRDVQHAESRTSIEPKTLDNALDAAAALVDKSLLRREDQDDGEPRFWMLETVRELGHEELEVTGEDQLARRRHAAYFLGLAETGARCLHTSEQRAWMARLVREHPNLRAALRWSRAQPDMLEIWTRLSAALGWFWWVHGDWSEGRRWMEAVEERATAGEEDCVPHLIRARMLNGAAHIARVQSDYVRGKALADQGLREALAAGDRREIAWSRLARAAIALDEVEFEHGVTWSNEVATIGREIGDMWITALALYFLGFMHRSRGEIDQSMAFHQECLVLRRQIGDDWGISWSLHDLGLVALEQGDHQRARGLLEEGLALHRELNHQRGIGWSLNDLGVAALATGDVEEARTRLRQSLTMRHEQGDKRGVAESLAAMGSLALAEGRPGQAAQLLAAATTLRESVGLVLWPVEHQRHLREVAAVRQALTRSAFTAAWAVGRAMSLDRSLATALTTETSTDEMVDPTRLRDRRESVGPLSPRESEVARLVAHGSTNGQIAEVLVIAERTVESHIANICGKLRFNSRAQVAAWAAQHGLLDGSSPVAARVRQRAP
jgi:predicted ATPase/DNA-binding CsgD family transcriptional regulator